MGLFQKNRRSISIVGLTTPAAIFLVVLTSMPSIGHSSDLTVIGGIVERVSGSDITLATGTYDIGHARLMTVSGLELPPSELARGRKVDLLFKKGKIATVVIYPAVMLE